MSTFHLVFVTLLLLLAGPHVLDALKMTIKRRYTAESKLSDDKVIIGDIRIDGSGGYGNSWEIKGQELGKTKKSKDFYDLEKRFSYEGDPCAAQDCLSALDKNGRKVYIIPFDAAKYDDHKQYIRVGGNVEWNSKKSKLKDMKDTAQAFHSLMRKLGDFENAELEIVDDDD